MQIRAAELTADHLGRGLRVATGDQTFVIGRIVKIRHKRVGDAVAPETETRLAVEVIGDQLIALHYNSIGVVELV